MRDWTNYLFYGLAAAVIVLTYVATNELESRLKSIETQLDIQATIIEKLKQGE